ncbi:hypothetical protein M0813_08962 [Anaeramoeba flamelloides]|uniref:Uncharacterized protein n=1 Tax=Anaeramoeba flamelloides TaxID=1746091 RepID=A0AAV7Y9J3_9EUKA|nr:hypothetical protein M0812_28629 [Anaeramoeba flamelloides]KAJ6228138.1 hypothetical protein M0813_08962 [Anaeramoeba flamelloides]
MSKKTENIKKEETKTPKLHPQDSNKLNPKMEQISLSQNSSFVSYEEEGANYVLNLLCQRIMDSVSKSNNEKVKKQVQSHLDQIETLFDEFLELKNLQIKSLSKTINDQENLTQKELKEKQDKMKESLIGLNLDQTESKKK